MSRPVTSTALVAALALAGSAGARTGIAPVPVPDVVNTDVQSAYAALHTAGFRVTCRCRIIRAETLVATQTPAAGTVVGRSATVTIELSSPGAPHVREGYRSAPVPDLTDEPVPLALEWASSVGAPWIVKTGAGLERGNAPDFFGNFAVAGQSPRAGDALAVIRPSGKKPRLAAVVFRARQASAPVAPLVRVPDAVGDLLAGYETLHRAGFRVTCPSGDLDWYSPLAPQVIAGQVPQAGTLARRGATVIIELMIGPEDSPLQNPNAGGLLPTFVGESPGAGLSWAGSVGLYADVDLKGGLRRGDAPDFWDNFVVTAQSPADGELTGSDRRELTLRAQQTS